MTKNKVHVKKGDTVQVLSGKNKGKRGKVLTVIPSTNKVIIENVNMLTKHTKPRSQGEVGGIIKQEGAINASKVLKVCEKCERPTRIGRKILEDGSKVRFCKKCGEVFNN